jgi:hypothetical protein
MPRYSGDLATGLALTPVALPTNSLPEVVRTFVVKTAQTYPCFDVFSNLKTGSPLSLSG